MDDLETITWRCRQCGEPVKALFYLTSATCRCGCQQSLPQREDDPRIIKNTNNAS